MKIFQKITMLLLAISLPLAIFAQDKPVSMMRSNGRIYVVVAVVLTILIGLILYVVRLDRKMTRLEKDNK